MTNTNATNFRENAYSFLKQTIQYNEPVNISTKDGNAVLLSEAEYNSLVETLYLTSQPGIEEKLIAGKRTPLEECVDESEVSW